MPDGTVAYLVVRRDDGFGDVYPLAAGQRYTLGRAATNRIVLKDDLCSREHAEVYQLDGHWRLGCEFLKPLTQSDMDIFV